MLQHLDKAPKAYQNKEFLKSPFARPIRLLTEYIEPFVRLTNNKVKDTIVFFGSARIKESSNAKKELKQLEKKYKYSPNLDNKIKAKLIDKIESAKKDLEFSKYYDDAYKLSYLLTDWSKKLGKGNKFVICSGGGPGIMEAANKGACKAKGLSIGFNISLPFEQYPNAYITPDLNFEFHYFFMRKFWFAYLAKAIVIMPGGFGTLDELMEVLTLVQTNKLKKKMAIIIYDEKFWRKIINFEMLAEYNMISKDDLNLFSYANTPEEAFEILKKELRKNYIK
jgi:uncharacterized protein (TIGR00730 family)